LSVSKGAFRFNRDPAAITSDAARKSRTGVDGGVLPRRAASESFVVIVVPACGRRVTEAGSAAEALTILQASALTS
jgi:hypothetical protein